jgi:hypothetical protein
MKKIAVIGGLGNMGRRYALILKHLGHEPIVIDFGSQGTNHPGDIKKADGIIIATPTKNHVSQILEYSEYKKPILCEKPFSKVFAEVEKAVNVDCPLRMINQYEHYMLNWAAAGKTWYNYFKTGDDGLLWDCISIIGLARGEIAIKNDSVIWDCWINGKMLDIRWMDNAYIWMIQDWIAGNNDNKSYILKAHKRVMEMVKKHD